MPDPLDYWCGNTEVLEALTRYLSLSDVGRCCQLSWRWRAALDQDHLWWRLAGRLEGCREMYHTVVALREPEGGLAPLCGWARTVSVCRGVRERWRRSRLLSVGLNVGSSQVEQLSLHMILRPMVASK